MLRNLGYLEEERNEQIRKENERRFQQEQQRINNSSFGFRIQAV